MKGNTNAVNTVEGFKNDCENVADEEGLDSVDDTLIYESFDFHFDVNFPNIREPVDEATAEEMAVDMVVDAFTDYDGIRDADTEYFNPVITRFKNEILSQSDEIVAKHERRKFERNHQPPY